MLGRLDSRRVVVLADVDPDLVAAIEVEEAQVARGRSIARVINLEPPAWDTTAVCTQAEDGWLGLYLVDGLLVRRVNVGKRAACELFGPTDLIRPWDGDGEYPPLPISIDWIVVKPTRLAVLDREFMLRIAPWPTISSRLVSRVAQRARYLALNQVVTHLPRAHARLLTLFWLLAERWGRVTTDGVYVTLPLTHELLAMLVGAHRPTVTLALQRLNRSGFLIREHSDRWLLTHSAIENLAHPDTVGLLGEDEPAVHDPVGFNQL